MHDDVGLAGLLDQRPDAEPGVAGAEARVADPVELGVGLGVDDRVGDVLDPPDLAGVGGHAQADRADPAVEVEEPLARRRGRRTRARPRRGARPSRCWSAGRRRGRRAGRARRAARAGTPRRGRRSAPSCPPESPPTTVCRSTGGSGISASEVTRRVCSWPGAAALADDQVAQHAGRASAAVVGGQAARRRPLADRVAGGVVGLGGEQAVVDVDDRVPAPAGVEAERGGVLRRGGAEGVLELVAVAPLLDAPRRSARPRGSSKPPIRSSASRDLRRLVGELELVGEALPGGARGRARRRAGRCRRSARGPARAARRSRPRPRSASTCRPGRGRGRPAARRRRRRRSRPSVRATPRPPWASESIAQLELVAAARPCGSRGRLRGGCLAHPPMVAGPVGRPPRRLEASGELLLDLGEDALARLVVVLVGADLAQLGPRRGRRAGS